MKSLHKKQENLHHRVHKDHGDFLRFSLWTLCAPWLNLFRLVRVRKWHLKKDSVQAMTKKKWSDAQTHPTKRAADWWDSSLFSDFFLASGFSCSRSESKPAPPPLTPAVGRLW
jgi:hypothetical protein